MEDSNFFVYKDKIDGKVAIGQLPQEFDDLLEEIKIEWKKQLTQEDLNSSTCHEWYVNLKQSLKTKIDAVRNMKLWQSLCDENNGVCKKGKILYVPEMDEIYYSNFGLQNKSGRLYGANGNIEPHVDSARLFVTKGITLYRVLIGLGDKNTNTSTKMTNAGISKKINKNDYVVFDFNRTVHQVIKENKIDMPRYLLKLHFIVCENIDEPDWKVELFKKTHIMYEAITRYVMDNGTDPRTWYEFFLGLILEIDLSIYFIVCLISLYVLIKIYNVTNPIKITKYIFLNISITYLIIVTYFWIYYLITKER